MHGIYIAALPTSLLGIAGVGAVIHRLKQPAPGWLLVVATLISLASSADGFSTWYGCRWTTGTRRRF